MDKIKSPLWVELILEELNKKKARKPSSSKTNERDTTSP